MQILRQRYKKGLYSHGYSQENRQQIFNFLYNILYKARSHIWTGRFKYLIATQTLKITLALLYKAGWKKSIYTFLKRLGYYIRHSTR